MPWVFIPVIKSHLTGGTWNILGEMLDFCCWRMYWMVFFGNGEEFLCLFPELMVFAVHIKSKQVSCSTPPFFLLSLQVSSSGWVPAWRERECSLIPTYQGSVKGASWWYWWVLGDREYRDCALFCQHCPVGRVCSSCWMSWEWNIPKGRWNNRGLNLLDGFSWWEGGIGAEQLHCFCGFFCGLCKIRMEPGVTCILGMRIPQFSPWACPNINIESCE